MTAHSEQRDESLDGSPPRIHHELARLADKPLVLDVLTVVAVGDATLSALCKELHARRPAVVGALRQLAACDLVRHGDGSGSWDEPPPRRARYRLTPSGRRLVRGLDDLAVLVQLYRYYLDEPMADGQRLP